MPTINKRFLLALVAVTLALAGGLFAAHLVQARRIPDALKGQADRAAEAGKADRAAHYLRQFLEFRPDDPDAQEQLAAILKQRAEARRKEGRRGDLSELLLLYDKVLRTDPGREAVRRDALDLCLQMRRYTDAETHAQELLKAHPADAGLWQQLAAAQAGLQQTDAARTSYETAVKHAPADPLAYQRLAQYLWRDLKRPKEAAVVVDRLVAALPNEPEAYLTRARLHLYTRPDTTSVLASDFVGDLKQAMADLRKALEIDPKNAEGLLLTAEQYQHQRKLAAARDCLATGMRLHPQDVRFVRGLAWLDLNRGNVGAAVGVLEDGMTRLPDAFELLVPLGDLMVQLGETQRAEEIVRRVEARHAKSPGEARRNKMQASYLRARVAMRNADWPKAVELLTALRTDAIDLPGLENQTSLLLAVCHRERGETDLEQETLRLVLSKDPNHLAARVALALSQLNAGRTTEAIKEYQQAVKSPYANPATHATLLRLLARQYRLSGGRTRDWAQLERVAGELDKVYGPASSEPVRVRAELAEAKGDLQQAAAVLRAEAARRPGDARLWAALADKVADLGGVAAGLGVIDEAQAAAGDGPELRLARADLYARDPAALRSVDPLGTQIEGWSDRDQVQLLFGLVEVYDRLGDQAKVVQSYRRLAARRPGDLGVWEALGERAFLVGDMKAAAEAAAHATKLDPSGKSEALFVAWAAVAAKSADAARPAIDGLVTAFGPKPDRAAACVALARLKARAGDADAAGALFERAVRLEPTRFPPMQAYLGHLAATGHDDAMTAVLGRLARDHRWAGDPFRRAVRGAMAGLPADVARKLLAVSRKYVEPEPGGLGWLGDCYLAAGLTAEARDCFNQATATKVAGPDDWLRLAVRTAEGSAPQDGTKVLQVARGKMPLPVFFAVAAAFRESKAASPDWAPAFETPAEKRLFTQARLAVTLSRYQRAEAIALLKSFLDTKPEAKADQAWARRNLAMLLAVRGAAADRKKAMDLLMADNDAGKTADEKRSTAAVLTALSRHLDNPQRKTVIDRSIKVLADLVNETRSPRDAFLLAQVYRASNNRTASQKVLNKLLEADPKNLDYLVMGLEDVTEQGDFPAAEPFAKHLLVYHPGEYRAIAAVARYECTAGRPEKALALAEGYTRTADATAGDLPARSARVAELLDELARMPTVRRTEAGKAMVQSAVKRYEDLATARPEAVIAAAGLLAADSRHADAFTLIEKHARPMPPRMRAAAGLAALRAGGASDRQFAQVRAWLDEALAEDPNSLTLKLNEGEFFALRQQYDLAEKAYQSVLDRDPRNVVALNNLAWILSPRPDRAEESLKLVDRAVAEVGLTGELLDTRARVRIAAKQFTLAEKDLLEALTQEKTPLRLFHLAMAKEGQSPPRKDEARDAFRKARDRGLEPRSIHPADLPVFRVFDAESPKKAPARPGGNAS
ncbi:MAG TPA: tetratricopeptide repeat protein [Fimbriiglobus sp.]|nr:tetratricopeptide repeat protein [Fimbriiglobus sp.]